MSQRVLFLSLIGALICGVGVGAFVNASVDDALASEVAGVIRIGSDLFLRLIKMIIAPLVVTTLSVGIARIGGGATLGRIGARTMAWFICASLVSLSLGLLMANITRPGEGFDASVLMGQAIAINPASLSLRDFITHVVPTSIFDAMATNEVLQIVVFSVLLGMALQALGSRVGAVTDLLEQGSHVMLKITGYVMLLAPLAVFSAIASVIAVHGIGVLADYGRLVAAFFLSLLVLWGILLCAGYVVLGPRVVSLIFAVRTPLLLAFSTSSSEAAYPRLLERLEQFGIPNRVASFVLPLGYSFNLDGSMMYCAFAIMFISQALGVEISLGQQAIMLLILMVTSKGIASVPRASLVIIAAALPTFGMPAEAIGLVLAADAFMDMGRSATNVIGNSIACAAVARWEGLLSQAPAAFESREEATAPEAAPTSSLTVV